MMYYILAFNLTNNIFIFLYLQVPESEGRLLASRFGCRFAEVSAAEMDGKVCTNKSKVNGHL